MADESSETHLDDALRWAVEAAENPSLATADWLSRDIAPQYPGVFALLSDPGLLFEHLVAAKDAFKTLRIVGETVADRQFAARLYAVTIAIGLVRFEKRISRQSDRAIEHALRLVQDDHDLPEPLRDTAALARTLLRPQSGERS